MKTHYLFHCLFLIPKQVNNGPIKKSIRANSGQSVKYLNKGLDYAYYINVGYAASFFF